MNKQKVIVTGANGMLGYAVCEELKKYENIEVVACTREECDLLSESETFSFFNDIRPDFVVHCAAKVGGIGANKNYPVEFLTENVSIQNNVFKASKSVGVKRLLFFASNAVYPAGIDRPIKEIDILTGAPEETVRPYALAKLSGIELCYSYNKQYNTQFLSLIPVNLYGPKDNFHPENSHVLPALIRKFHNAKINNEASVEIWGSGNQRREFMCSLDLARIASEVLFFEDSKFSQLCNEYPPLLNIGVDDDTSIKELASAIKSLVGYEGELRFDTTKPEGIQKKQTSVEKMHSFGLHHQIELTQGLEIIYDYYKKNVI